MFMFASKLVFLIILHLDVGLIKTKTTGVVLIPVRRIRVNPQRLVKRAINALLSPVYLRFLSQNCPSHFILYMILSRVRGNDVAKFVFEISFGN